MHCNICGAGLACSETGRDAHYKKYHNVVVKREYKPMDPKLKERIVAAFEARHQGKFFFPEKVLA